ncbi:M56 family metallopeptidase [Bacillus sp. FJAT-26390]|uniref:M56 family metallopeptidase n=1 Tax=Bacillus sp. FJAT-26390 TaxID=1743142 RepID=UPI001146C2AE|nr:M56 family metallopeptidase [Bacillus sp. FJAT-26390]
MSLCNWFNPVVWYGLYRMRLEQEMACDASVLRSSSLKETYAACIVNMLEIGAAERMLSASTPFSGYKKQIARRIIMIRSFQHNKNRYSLIGLVILIVAAMLSLPSAFAAGTAEATDGKLTFSSPADGQISTSYDYQIQPNSLKKTA